MDYRSRELESLVKQFEAEKQKLRDKFAESGMELPDTLYRIHYRHRETVFDKEDYVLSQESQTFPELDTYSAINRNVPMVHPKDWELIARYFGFPEFIDSGKYFTLLYLNTWKVELTHCRPRVPLLQHGEYYGRIPRSGIIKQTRFTWVEDGNPLPPELSSLNDPVLQESKGYSIVPLEANKSV